MKKQKDFSAAMNFITKPTETPEEPTTTTKREITPKSQITTKESPSELEALLASKGYTEKEINKALSNLGYNKIKETKTKRVQLLIKPSQYEQLRALSEEKKTSINALIEKAINNLIDKELIQ